MFLTNKVGLRFDMHNYSRLAQRQTLTIRPKGQFLLVVVFKVWKSLRNKVVLSVKRISYFLHFSLLYVVYRALEWMGSLKNPIVYLKDSMTKWAENLQNSNQKEFT